MRQIADVTITNNQRQSTQLIPSENSGTYATEVDVIRRDESGLPAR
jgi:hypothetical protein